MALPCHAFFLVQLDELNSVVPALCLGLLYMVVVTKLNSSAHHLSQGRSSNTRSHATQITYWVEHEDLVNIRWHLMIAHAAAEA